MKGIINQINEDIKKLYRYEINSPLTKNKIKEKVLLMLSHRLYNSGQYQENTKIDLRVEEGKNMSCVTVLPNNLFTAVLLAGHIPEMQIIENSKDEYDDPSLPYIVTISNIKVRK